MTMAPISALSANRVSANYGTPVTAVRQPKRVDYADPMVVEVADSKKTAKAYNDIASRMQGQNNFYDSSLQGGSYGVEGSNFDMSV